MKFGELTNLRKCWELQAELGDAQTRLDEIQYALQQLTPPNEELRQTKAEVEKSVDALRTKMLDALQEELQTARAELTAAITQNKRLTRREKNVLKLRYVDCRKWKEVNWHTNYSAGNTYAAHKRALKKISEDELSQKT